MIDYGELVLGAYLGEVAGEAAFAGMAMLIDDPARRSKLEVLRLLEAQTEARLRPLAEAHGLTAAAVVEARRRGWGHATMAPDAEARWAQVVNGMTAVCPGEIEKFRRLRTLAPAAEQSIAAEVLAHEEALLAFAQREADGRGDTSLEPVVALLHDPYRAEARVSAG
jgi:hypothetical protein